MRRTTKCLFIISVLILCSCKEETKSLSNTKWQVVKFVIEPNNYLNDLERQIYSEFDTSVNLYAEFKDSIVLTYVEGKKIDTSAYNIKDDTLFYSQDFRRDTNIILKLTSDSLITWRLNGVSEYAIRKR